MRIEKVAAVVCIATCIADIAVLNILGSCYPGYSQLKNTMSSLGASVSPVSNQISSWWIFIGLIFIFFGIGFRKAFAEKCKSAKFASWLIILYGVGEGIGSGAFKANHAADTMATSLIIHDVLGGVGVVAILNLPLVLLKVFPKKELPWFYILSWIVFVAGIVMMLLFSYRISTNENNVLMIYQGLWQRLSLLNTYLYFIAIAFIMLKKVKFNSLIKQDT